jgi:hypothetical protein
LTAAAAARLSFTTCAAAAAAASFSAFAVRRAAAAPSRRCMHLLRGHVLGIVLITRPLRPCCTWCRMRRCRLFGRRRRFPWLGRRLGLRESVHPDPTASAPGPTPRRRAPRTRCTAAAWNRHSHRRQAAGWNRHSHHRSRARRQCRATRPARARSRASGGRSATLPHVRGAAARRFSTSGF